MTQGLLVSLVDLTSPSLGSNSLRCSDYPRRMLQNHSERNKNAKHSKGMELCHGSLWRSASPPQGHLLDQTESRKGSHTGKTFIPHHFPFRPNTTNLTKLPYQSSPATGYRFDPPARLSLLYFNPFLSIPTPAPKPKPNYTDLRLATHQPRGTIRTTTLSSCLRVASAPPLSSSSEPRSTP